MSCTASTAEYARCNNNDGTTTSEYFTGANVVQIQHFETLPSLTLSLWNSTLNLTISQVTITEAMKQICADRSQIDLAYIIMMSPCCYKTWHVIQLNFMMKNINFMGPSFDDKFKQPKPWQGNHVNSVGLNCRSSGHQSQGSESASSRDIFRFSRSYLPC